VVHRAGADHFARAPDLDRVGVGCALQWSRALQWGHGYIEAMQQRTHGECVLEHATIKTSDALWRVMLRHGRMFPGDPELELEVATCPYCKSTLGRSHA
jgi:hypothetical protein